MNFYNGIITSNYTFEVFEFDMEASLSTPTISPTKKKILATVTVKFAVKNEVDDYDLFIYPYYVITAELYSYIKDRVIQHTIPIGGSYHGGKTLDVTKSSTGEICILEFGYNREDEDQIYTDLFEFDKNGHVSGADFENPEIWKLRDVNPKFEDSRTWILKLKSLIEEQGYVLNEGVLYEKDGEYVRMTRWCGEDITDGETDFDNYTRYYDQGNDEWWSQRMHSVIPFDLFVTVLNLSDKIVRSGKDATVKIMLDGSVVQE